MKERKLTHQLVCDEATKLWSCQCGYVLGSGHDALYAQCPLARPVYSDFNEAKQLKARQSGARKGKRKVSQRVADLFDL